jgi:hypothetical protein
MGTTPVFVAAPKTWQQSMTTANANRDGTGTLVDVVSAGSNGSRVDSIHVEAQATTTPGMVRLYLFDGTTNRLFDEIPVSAVVPSGTVKAFQADISYPDGLVLPSGWKLRAAPHNSETFNIFARGGDF